MNTYGDEDEPLDDRFDRYRDQERAVANQLAGFTRYPCKDWLATGAHDVDPLNE